MELSQVTDLQQLKAMAYDQIANKEQAERALRAINDRIVEVAGMDAEQVRASLPNGEESTTTTTTEAPASDSAPTGGADAGNSNTTTTTETPSV